MEALERVLAASFELKLFPLPSAVLLPGGLLPLHIFEPRYRELVEDCLAGDRVMAIGGLAPGWEGHYLGRPALLPICCAGLVVWHERQEDGRFNIALQGVTRMRVLEELPVRHGYREVRAQPLADRPYDGDEVALVRQAVLELAARVPQQLGQTLLEVVSRTEGGQLADVLGAALSTDLDRRQKLLLEQDVRARLLTVLDEVGDLIVRAAPHTPSGLPN